MAIPYVREIEFEYGIVEQVSPLIRRVIANNPGPFTYVGTGVYIIGHGEVAVIDPGPEDAEHFEALKRALEGRRSPTFWSLMAIPTIPPWRRLWRSGRGELGSADDLGFMPDVKVGDGDVISGPGWTLDVIETPGHTCNHLCFGLREENACLSGDHIMGWSTTVVAPPDGDMGDYMRSLDKIQSRKFDTLWPTHGDPVRGREFVDHFITEYANHRRAREAAILDQLRAGQSSIPEMVKVMYAEVDKRLHPAAAIPVSRFLRTTNPPSGLISNW
ncbi:beta-lactamase-like protein [Ostreococcus tauri]|uniref:Beta-lactamase-like protein n=1 Tax=Ostreococcus tauri TaxID=70448 RepID=A0A1Y5I5K6_OSTTA|nr:beta-lactamase-like protein [Ostreococcus tauri]